MIPDCNDGCKVFLLQVNKSFITSPFLKRPQNGFITSSKSEISWFSKFLLQVDFITSGFYYKSVLVDHFTKTLKTSLVWCWNLKFWILKTQFSFFAFDEFSNFQKFCHKPVLLQVLPFYYKSFCFITCFITWNEAKMNFFQTLVKSFITWNDLQPIDRHCTLAL